MAQKTTTQAQMHHEEGPVWLIAGAGGGIGRAILDQVLAADEACTVLATHRQPVCSITERVTWYKLDFDEADSLNEFCDAVDERVARIDRLVCCTGFLSDANTLPEKRLQELDVSTWQRSMKINAFGPMALLAGVEHLLKVSSAPRVGVLSAQVGSIEDNRTGGWYAYRMAKAALNMGLKSAAIEMERWQNGPVVLAVHPGTTRTELSKPFTRRRKARIRSAEETGSNIVDLIERADVSLNGAFLTAEGDPLPW